VTSNPFTKIKAGATTLPNGATKTKKMTKIEIFTQAIKGVKFTPPQKKVVEKILQGYEIKVVNKHRLNGGEMKWKSPHSEYLEYAGKIYKAFFNVFYQIKKQTGTEFCSSNFCS
jgi:hypothetical protein